MTNEEIIKLIESSIAGSKVEEVTDQPGDDVVVFRVETPLVNFQIEQQIAVFAYFKQESNLLQFSDRGLYSFCIEDRSHLNLRRHRNFIRSSGHLVLGSESEEDSFVVNSPTLDVTAEGFDLPTFLGHYLSLLIYCGEV